MILRARRFVESGTIESKTGERGPPTCTLGIISPLPLLRLVSLTTLTTTIDLTRIGILFFKIEIGDMCSPLRCHPILQHNCTEFHCIALYIRMDIALQHIFTWVVAGHRLCTYTGLKAYCGIFKESRICTYVIDTLSYVDF